VQIEYFLILLFGITLCSRAAAGNESACATKSEIEFDGEAVKSDGASRRVQQFVITRAPADKT
jgi:hypothetical protein